MGLDSIFSVEDGNRAILLMKDFFEKNIFSKKGVDLDFCEIPEEDLNFLKEKLPKNFLGDVSKIKYVGFKYEGHCCFYFYIDELKEFFFIRHENNLDKYILLLRDDRRVYMGDRSISQ